MPQYVATVILTLSEFDADSKDDAVQYAYEEYLNMIESATVYVKEVK